MYGHISSPLCPLLCIPAVRPPATSERMGLRPCRLADEEGGNSYNSASRHPRRKQKKTLSANQSVTGSRSLANLPITFVSGVRYKTPIMQPFHSPQIPVPYVKEICHRHLSGGWISIRRDSIVAAQGGWASTQKQLDVTHLKFSRNNFVPDDIEISAYLKKSAKSASSADRIHF